MGSYLFKSDTLDFAVLPSENIEGPLGLACSKKPVRRTLDQYDLFQLIVDIITYAELADCSKRWHWASVAICRRQFDDAMNCTKKQ